MMNSVGNKMKYSISSYLISFVVVLSADNALAQKIDTSADRIKTDFQISLPYIGSVKPRSATEIESSNWMIGCETLDRDFADYDSYKEYLNPLGIKLIRLQAGWDKTEHVKGNYDWAWLDHIINDATKRGLKPWLQISYGNHNYPGGGGANLGAGMPHSDEALKAWDKWAESLVIRYKDKVKDWEVWNEPNFSDNAENTPEKTAMLNIRTAEIIKRLQPDAKISGLALGHISVPYVQVFAKILYEKGKLHLFDNMVYHDYVYNPDANYKEVEEFKHIFQQYDPKMKIRQGENGAPSSGGPGRGAIGDYDWTEVSQAKWDVRRMLGNLGHDVECSVFTIIDIAYTAGPISRLNVKGLIESDSTKKVIRPKIAYYAVQNVAAVFDHSLLRITDLHWTYNRNLIPENKDQVLYTKGTDRSLSVYGYKHKTTGKQLYTIWNDEYIPTNSNVTRSVDFNFVGANFNQPVYVDILTGKVYEIPAAQWSKQGDTYSFKKIPIYDSPILIADKSLITMK